MNWVHLQHGIGLSTVLEILHLNFVCRGLGSIYCIFASLRTCLHPPQAEMFSKWSWQCTFPAIVLELKGYVVAIMYITQMEVIGTTISIVQYKIPRRTVLAIGQTTNRWDHLEQPARHWVYALRLNHLIYPSVVCHSFINTVQLWAPWSWRKIRCERHPRLQQYVQVQYVDHSIILQYVAYK